MRRNSSVVRAAICIASGLLATAHASAAFPTYILTPLTSANSTVAGTPTTVGYSINKYGQVSGTGGGALVGSGVRGNRWDSPIGKPLYIGLDVNPGPGTGSSIGYGINNNFAVAGTSTAQSVTSTVWTPDSPNPQTKPNAAAPQVASYFVGINDNNQAAGRSFSDAYSGFPNQAAYWSEPTGLVALKAEAGVTRYNSSMAYDINQSGQMVGVATAGVPGLNGSVYARRWDSYTAEPVVLRPVVTDPQFTTNSTAWAINDNGFAVGNSTTGGSVGTLWAPDGTPSVIGRPTGYNGNSVYPQDINNSNVAVGIYGNIDYGGKANKLSSSGPGQSGSRRAFVWSQANGSVPLSNLIDPASPTIDGFGWSVLLEANSINDSGQITGFGQINGKSIAYIATPVTYSPRWFNTDGAWPDQINWFGLVPNAPGKSAEFGIASGDRSISVPTDVTVGTLKFDSNYNYTLAGAGSVTLASGSAARASINLASGTATLATTTRLAVGTDVTIAPTGSLTLTRVAATDAAGTAGLAVSGGGTLALDGGYTAGPITVAGGSLVDVDADATLVVRTADVAALRASVAQFLATGTSGLGSSELTPATTLAVFPNTVAGAPGVAYYDSYNTLPATAADVIVRVTYLGDTNIDGVLDGEDLTTIIESITTGRTGWQNGDVNYDNVVNALDLQAFLAVFQLALPPLPGGPNGTGSTPGGAVPEPTTAALLLPAAALLARRTRR